MNYEIPGTNMKYSSNDEAFSMFRPMIQITGGLSLSQVCAITGLQTSTIQNWVKRGYAPRPIKKKYQERHLARILLISSLRDCMNIEEIGELMKLINGDTEDESDDIISESKLYDYFSRCINNLDTNLQDDQIEKTVTEVLTNEEQTVKQKLVYALKVMVYAYILGKCLKQINNNLELLKK